VRASLSVMLLALSLLGAACSGGAPPVEPTGVASASSTVTPRTPTLSPTPTTSAATMTATPLLTPTVDSAATAIVIGNATVGAMRTLGAAATRTASVPTPTPTPTATATTTPVPVGRVGQEVTAGGVGLQVTEVTQVPNSTAGGPTAVRVQVVVANRGSDPQSYDRANFALRDAGGAQYAPTGGDLPAGTLQPGETAKETVEFALPPGSKAIVLRYDPGLGERGLEPLQVYLGDL
jgi:hypothetical protein